MRRRKAARARPSICLVMRSWMTTTSTLWSMITKPVSHSPISADIKVLLTSGTAIYNFFHAQRSFI